jgi:hypothetical protein
MIGLAFGLFTPTQAAASNHSFITWATGCDPARSGLLINQTDNRSIYFWYDNLYGPTADAQTFTNWYALDTTGIIRTYGDVSYNATTDVVVKDEDYQKYCGYHWYDPASSYGQQGIPGMTLCLTHNSVGACEQHHVRYDAQYIYVASTNQRRALTCHETGHVLGLHHRNAGEPRNHACMERSAVGSYYSAHDVGHFSAILP